MCKQRTFKKTNVFKPFSFSLDFFSLERFRLCLYFLNSYFFVFVCHYSLRITSRAEYTHTNASSFFWSRSVVVLISLSVSSERASISLLRRRRSRSKKKEARLFHSLRRRAFPTLRDQIVSPSRTLIRKKQSHSSWTYLAKLSSSMRNENDDSSDFLERLSMSRQNERRKEAMREAHERTNFIYPTTIFFF